MSVSYVASTDTQYAVKLDQFDANTLYIGLAPIATLGSDPGWQIRRFLTTGSVSDLTWADGDQQFDNVWDNRTSLTYI